LSLSVGGSVTRRNIGTRSVAGLVLVEPVKVSVRSVSRKFLFTALVFAALVFVVLVFAEQAIQPLPYFRVVFGGRGPRVWARGTLSIKRRYWGCGYRSSRRGRRPRRPRRGRGRSNLLGIGIISLD
jgi:hypothetical protein